MSIRYSHFLKLSLCVGAVLAGCTSTRQLAVDYPGAGTDDPKSAQSVKTRPFQALPDFQSIDGDDYYVRLIAEFDFKGDNALRDGCDSMAPSFSKNDLSSALIFNVRNSILKFNTEAVGYSYQTISGKCNFKFDAKKQNLTPWMRLDAGKETQVDYSVYSSANSDVDVMGLVNKATAASSLLAFTGVGMGVAVLGQFAGQWFTNNQQNQTVQAPTPAANHSAEIHSLPAFVSYTDKSGALYETVFKVHAVTEGGANILGADIKPLGELRVYPEITASMLLKTKAGGLPDARDLSLAELSQSAMKSATGDINLQQLIGQSKHPEKPNLQPDWNNYEDVHSNCRKIKVVMKDLGFNKFDRNAYIYYFLLNSADWKNYNVPAQKVGADDINAKTLQSYRSKNFGNCLISDDFAAMKAMGLSVNTESDWAQMGDSSQKKEQFFMPLKSIERQLLTVLKNTNQAEMESQIYPLINTFAKGDGTVLLQNHLGDFGLEKLLQPATPIAPVPAAEQTASPKAPAIAPTTIATPAPIPGEGLIITARQLVQVFLGLAFNELSCARVVPEQMGKSTATAGILLFATKEGSPRAKGGAMEFEFSGGKINRIAFQSPSYRDFEQDAIDHPEIGGCRVDPALLTKLH
ncbi:MAG: hypothetical protein PHH59_09185 [Methylovulum sp.]|uniref:hypothetical protein n=1 Tax=Methylovulum sp. TaxID=1916980 RepID=UPI002612B958|nr:hypothetical protein [Methylovulum sp.]MDD2724177.1 hypothetical protein [Methylovulum sp.]MDD5123209.1 hypothetical protein [Methylovulum sp.]